jgi:hypothetical protein
MKHPMVVSDFSQIGLQVDTAHITVYLAKNQVQTTFRWSAPD